MGLKIWTRKEKGSNDDLRLGYMGSIMNDDWAKALISSIHDS